MLKRFLITLLAVCVCLALFGCTKKEEEVAGVVENPWTDTEAENSESENNTPAKFETDTSDTPAVTNATEADEDNSETESELNPSAPTSENTDETDTEETEETTIPAATSVPVTEYEWYLSLSGEEQEAYMDSFDSVAAFFDWYNAAKAEYDALHPEIEIGDGVIDLGDLVGGNG